MLAVFGKDAYSYMHLVNQLTPIANPENPHDATYWPKHTYEKYYDADNNNEVYQVDAEKVTTIVSTIDSILTNKKLGAIVKSFLTFSDEAFEDAQDIADNLMSKRTVLLNIENLNKEISRRLIDFISGVAYAQGGNIKRVANRTYIITPYNVDILGDVLDGFNPDSFEF